VATLRVPSLPSESKLTLCGDRSGSEYTLHRPAGKFRIVISIQEQDASLALNSPNHLIIALQYAVTQANSGRAPHPFARGRSKPSRSGATSAFGAFARGDCSQGWSRRGVPFGNGPGGAAMMNDNEKGTLPASHQSMVSKLALLQKLKWPRAGICLGRCKGSGTQDQGWHGLERYVPVELGARGIESLDCGNP